MSQPFLSSVIRMDRESKQLSTHLSSQRSSPPASKICSVQPSLFPETEPERHESLPIRSYHCPAKPECHGFPCVTSFQPAISHRLWKSSPLIRKGTLTLGIYHRPFPTGRQIAGVRAFNTAGVYQRHGQCRASARPERDWFCSRHCHKYGKRNDRLILKQLTRQKQFAIQSI